jgi:hypothetical protein
MPWLPAAPVASRTGSVMTGISTAATEPTPTTPTWRPGSDGSWCCHRSAVDHGRRRAGACTSQTRPTSCAHAGAASRRSFRIAVPSTCSAPTPWTYPCAHLLLKLASSKADPSPHSSQSGGRADTGDTGRTDRCATWCRSREAPAELSCLPPPATLREEMAVSGQRLLAASGQIPWPPTSVRSAFARVTASFVRASSWTRA